jgi:hypothetical protein
MAATRPVAIFFTFSLGRSGAGSTFDVTELLLVLVLQEPVAHEP